MRDRKKKDKKPKKMSFGSTALNSTSFSITVYREYRDVVSVFALSRGTQVAIRLCSSRTLYKGKLMQLQRDGKLASRLHPAFKESHFLVRIAPLHESCLQPQPGPTVARQCTPLSDVVNLQRHLWRFSDLPQSAEVIRALQRAAGMQHSLYQAFSEPANLTQRHWSDPRVHISTPSF